MNDQIYRGAYDAVLSLLGTYDVMGQLSCLIGEISSEQQRPSVLFRPKISVEGNCWCALYGKDLQEGVAGFGKSPDEAMRDFDSNWEKTLAAHTME